ncbi:MAG: M48 family metallopeptidase [Desulfobulbaceae bacterium]|nr:MAG: M48 family metallopeptidase [Desulfobulbaceae bacterium]
MSSWQFIVLFLIVGTVILEILAVTLNLRALSSVLPDEFADVFTPEMYATSREYTRARCRLNLLAVIIINSVSSAFLLLGGFGVVAELIRGLGFGEIFSGLFFVAVLAFMAYCVSLPFNVYATFVIEEKFGFNRTTARIFILDAIKGMLLLAILGVPILTLVFWLFLNTGSLAWAYCWVCATLFSLLLHYLAPVLIMPLFTSFSPIADTSLQAKVEKYACKEKFRFKTIVTADGSKRSSKGNAFFTGFGRFRRIVLFDTLVDKLSDDEVVAVLAHEIGHHRLNHLWKMAVISSVQTALIFYTSSLIYNNKTFLQAFGVEQTSVYISLILIAYLYNFLDPLLSIPVKAISRRHEYQADSFAAATFNPRFLIGALKKLSCDNLSNLTPHPLYVFLHFSHPPIIKRLNALQHNDIKHVI